MRRTAATREQNFLDISLQRPCTAALLEVFATAKSYLSVEAWAYFVGRLKGYQKRR